MEVTLTIGIVFASFLVFMLGYRLGIDVGKLIAQDEKPESVGTETGDET